MSAVLKAATRHVAALQNSRQFVESCVFPLLRD